MTGIGEDGDDGVVLGQLPREGEGGRQGDAGRASSQDPVCPGHAADRVDGLAVRHTERAVALRAAMDEELRPRYADRREG